MEFEEAKRRIEAEGTNGINYGITTEVLLRVLEDWSNFCEFEVTEVGHDRVSLELRTLPEDLPAFCREVHALCPDIVDQGYGLAEDMVEYRPELAELIAGLDPQAEDFPLRVMARDLRQRRALFLWWD